MRLVDVLTPNQTEAKVLAGRSPDAAVPPEEVARDLIRAGVKQVVMTVGEAGALIVDASSAKHVPAVRVAAVDTTGAGDAFNAGIATALAFGARLEAAVEFGVIVGARSMAEIYKATGHPAQALKDQKEAERLASEIGQPR